MRISNKQELDNAFAKDMDLFVAVIETHEITYYKNYATHISKLPNTWTDEEYKDW